MAGAGTWCLLALNEYPEIELALRSPDHRAFVSVQHCLHGLTCSLQHLLGTLLPLGMPGMRELK